MREPRKARPIEAEKAWYYVNPSTIDIFTQSKNGDTELLTHAQTASAGARHHEASEKTPMTFDEPDSGDRQDGPVDAETVEAEDEAFDSSRHVSHFKTCDKPGQFSRKR